MPKLTDLGEMEIIRQIYFGSHEAKQSELQDVDPDEIMDRWLHTKIPQSSQ